MAGPRDNSPKPLTMSSVIPKDGDILRFEEDTNSWVPYPLAEAQTDIGGGGGLDAELVEIGDDVPEGGYGDGGPGVIGRTTPSDAWVPFRVGTEDATEAMNPSPELHVFTGDQTDSASNEQTGGLYIFTGENAGTGGPNAMSGPLNLNTGGTVDARSGNINIAPGVPTGTGERGNIRLSGGVEFQPQAAPPSSPSNGMVYYNSGDNKLYLRAAGAWVALN